jgi:glycosyltransferase involved in cell wall biosynthesis
MLVSAVIPAYNYARFVGRAIDSVFAQTYENIECIVVDDGSTDDTPAVLAAYGDRIRMLRQQNRGLSAARNAGITMARGECVALLDADDEWLPEKLAKQVALLQARPEVAVVGCGWNAVDSDGKFLFKVQLPAPGPGEDAVRGIALRKRWVCGSASAAVIRRHVLDEVGLFDETLTAAEDWDMWLRIGAEHKIANVPEVLLRIFHHFTGTFRNATKMEVNQQKVYEAAVRRWPDRLDIVTRRRIQALIASDAGHELSLAGDYDRAIRRYARSLRANPFQVDIWYAAARMLGRMVGV